MLYLLFVLIPRGEKNVVTSKVYDNTVTSIIRGERTYRWRHYEKFNFGMSPVYELISREQEIIES